MRLYCTIFIYLFSLLVTNSAIAGGLELPPEQKKAVMGLALISTWEQAIGSDGKRITPIDDNERNTIPVSDQMGTEIIRVGMLDGIAVWCAVEWEPHHKLYMKRIRKLYFTDKEIAYSSMLHGIVQGLYQGGKKGEQCDDKTRQKVAQTIADDNRQLEKLYK